MARLALLLVGLLLAGCTVPGNQDPPSYPRDVVGAGSFTRLVIEIDHAPGRAPSEAAKAHLLATLKNVTAKGEVVLLVQESLPGDARAWSAATLGALEKQTRTTAHAAPTAVLHVLYPAGSYEKEGVAGVTITGLDHVPTATVFLDTLRTLGSPLGPLPQPAQAVERLERSTLLHESGHAVGLVDNGIVPVQPHEDGEHEGHSSNPSSVMYWKVDSINGLRDYLLRDGSIPDALDAADIADLRSVGGR